jgi:hypothetical protein
MTLESLVINYLAILEEAGVPSPLNQRLMVAAVLADLCLVAEVEVPNVVVAALADEVRRAVAQTTPLMGGR